jgi:hypothetical protein
MHFTLRRSHSKQWVSARKTKDFDSAPSQLHQMLKIGGCFSGKIAPGDSLIPLNSDSSDSGDLADEVDELLHFIV